MIGKFTMQPSAITIYKYPKKNGHTFNNTCKQCKKLIKEVSVIFNSTTITNFTEQLKIDHK